MVDQTCEQNDKRNDLALGVFAYGTGQSCTARSGVTASSKRGLVKITLNMMVSGSSEMSITNYQTTRRQFLECSNLLFIIRS
jgi:hypothetical protein